MTDNEIIKALECCDNDKQCTECPMNDSYPFCDDVIGGIALSLINRQKAEIERYEKEHKENFDKWDRLAERAKNHYEELYQDAKVAVRAEAIKEFAERLKQKRHTQPMTQAEYFGISKEMFVVNVDDIDNLVKEMVGE